MGTLANPKHERFAQGLAKGHSAIKAYENAGYKPDRAAASRLSTNINIKSRVAELSEKTAEKVMSAISWEAEDLFGDMKDLIQQAAAAGDYKAAMEGQKFVIRCFGYEDAPTLTNEDLRKRTISVQAANKGDDGQPSEAIKANIMPFLDALKKVRRAS